MPISTAMTYDYKLGLMNARHDHGVAGNVFKLALFLAASANLDANLASYNDATGEVVAGGGYSTGGLELTNVAPSQVGTEVITNFNDAAFGPTTTISAEGCLIYNNTDASKGSVSCHDFGGLKESDNGSFTVVMPANLAGQALLRLV